MVDIGKLNKLKVVKSSLYGIFLDGEEDGEILLPKRYDVGAVAPGDEIEVFVCFDSEDRLVATTDLPFAMVGDFACLRVKSIENVGAFLDWGLFKDLFLPFSEQTRDLKVGHSVVVYIYVDKSDRIAASMRLDRYITKEAPEGLKEGDDVSVLIAARTDLGYKGIIQNKYWGMIFNSEVFRDFEFGQLITATIKTIRPDGKIDLTLYKEPGYKVKDEIGDKIVAALKLRGGFMNLTDKTPPETIYELFGVSKKKYKMALGGLYKRRIINVEVDGIRLL